MIEDTDVLVAIDKFSEFGWTVPFNKVMLK